MVSMDAEGVNRDREWESMRRLATEVMPAIRQALGSERKAA